MKKLAAYVAPVIVFAGLVGISSVALASDGTHTFRGTVGNLNAKDMTFTLVTPHSGNVMVKLDSDTQFTDRDHSVRHFSDLANGEKIKIRGDFSDTAKSVTDVNQVRFQHD